MTIEEAARDASLGRNDPLWNACWEIAGRDGYRDDPKTNNAAMCERAIRTMTPQQRARYFTETSS